MNTAMTGPSPEHHPLVSRERWLAERLKLLAREKALTRLGDQAASERRALPWIRVDKDCVLAGPRAGVRSPSSSRAADRYEPAVPPQTAAATAACCPPNA